MPQSLALRVFLPFALGYFASSIFRSINGVIAPDLVRDLGLDATELGFIGSTYFVGAMLLQIPLGILVDRYGPRIVYVVCLVLGAAGSAIFGLAYGVAGLAVGRFLTAIAAAASAACALKAYVLWYPKERLPFLNGLGFAAGGLGVMVGTTPVELALPLLDWRDIHMIAAAAILAAAIFVWAAVPRSNGGHNSGSLTDQIKGLGLVVRDLNFLRIAPLLVFMVGALGAMQSLWAGLWLRDVAAISGTRAANILLLIAASMTLSFFLSGPTAKVLGGFGLSPMSGSILGAVLFTGVAVALVSQAFLAPAAVAILWFLFAYFATMGMLAYAGLGQLYPATLIGRVNACLHLCWILGVFALQNIFGFVLDKFPTATPGSYAPEGHRIVIGIIAASTALAVLWYWAAPKLIGKRKIL